MHNILVVKFCFGSILDVNNNGVVFGLWKLGYVPFVLYLSWNWVIYPVKKKKKSFNYWSILYTMA